VKNASGNEVGWSSTSANSWLNLGSAYDNFTIEGFFYVANPAVNKVKVLIRKQSSYLLYVNFRGSSPAAVIFTIWFSPTQYIQLLTTRTIGTGWHHIAAVYANDETPGVDRLSIYLDGTRIATDNSFDLIPGIATSSSNLMVAGDVGGISSFGPWVDEVRLSSTVRYNGTTYTVPNIPFSVDNRTRALYHFDEQPDSAIFYDSAHGSNLTGNNGAHTGNP
jgi:hypothetical protein